MSIYFLVAWAWAGQQLTVDELVQDVVLQASSATEAVAVRAMDAKLRPEMVTESPPDETKLGRKE